MWAFYSEFVSRRGIHVTGSILIWMFDTVSPSCFFDLCQVPVYDTACKNRDSMTETLAQYAYEVEKIMCCMRAYCHAALCRSGGRRVSPSISSTTFVANPTIQLRSCSVHKIQSEEVAAMYPIVFLHQTIKAGQSITYCSIRTRCLSIPVRDV
uniref:AlNc14C12G1492 protein n=1 Tax=Albugo laibachii Nc14 TaxID=890382 RepID=F0W3B5_9STRA|nr:AlNc14C12G1492 [Albugo laibachii Nc14]|eukprot:CCA15558.1 AlNc14C12G1492 [Albugo laibachii Nc14]